MQQKQTSANQLSDHQPLVSIVCVTYNAAAVLPDLIKSVDAHKTDEIEFVVIDGNSTDDTLSIIKANEAVIDSWISEPDKGIYDAMNKSIAHTKGRWIIFLGADDTLQDEFLYMLPVLKDPHTVYYGNAIFYGKPFYKEYDDYYLTKLNICHQAIFYPRGLFDKYQYNLKYKVYADYHLNLRLWHDKTFKFVHTDYLIASFPEGGFSTHTKDVAFEADRDMLFKKYLTRKSYYRYLNRSIGFWKMLGRFILNK